MLGRGLRQADIARALGVDKNTIQATVARLRLMGVLVPGRPKYRSWISEPRETRADAHARVASDLAAGIRCPRCHLLRPCDHG